MAIEYIFYVLMAQGNEESTLESASNYTCQIEEKTENKIGTIVRRKICGKRSVLCAEKIFIISNVKRTPPAYSHHITYEKQLKKVMQKKLHQKISGSMLIEIFESTGDSNDSMTAVNNQQASPAPLVGGLCIVRRHRASPAPQHRNQKTLSTLPHLHRCIKILLSKIEGI